MSAGVRAVQQAVRAAGGDLRQCLALLQFWLAPARPQALLLQAQQQRRQPQPRAALQQEQQRLQGAQLMVTHALWEEGGGAAGGGAGALLGGGLEATWEEGGWGVGQRLCSAEEALVRARGRCCKACVLYVYVCAL